MILLWCNVFSIIHAFKNIMYVVLTVPSLFPHCPLTVPSLSPHCPLTVPSVQHCRHHVYKSRDAFKEHINLIVTNCVTYNGEPGVKLTYHCRQCTTTYMDIQSLVGFYFSY